MKKHIVSLVLIGIFVFVAGIKYKKYVVDYDYSKTKSVYTPKEKEKIFEYETMEIFIPVANMGKLERKKVKILKTNDRNKKIRLIYDKIVEKSKEIDDIINDSSKSATEDSEIKDNLYFNKIKLLDVFLQNERVYLNFDSKLVNSIVSEKQELLIIYSLVNSVTAVDGVNKVKILINNKNVKVLKFYNISDFFERDTSI